MALIDIRLRTVANADLQTLAAIEQESFPDPSWVAPDFLKYDCVVAEVAGNVAGFLVSREIFAGSPDTPPEREILNLAVATGVRRSGVGSRLLEFESQRKATLFLEVRESNSAAIQLYKKSGFIQISTRPRYYHHPSESAIVMCLK